MNYFIFFKFLIDLITADKLIFQRTEIRDICMSCRSAACTLDGRESKGGETYLLKRRFFPLKPPPPFCGRGARVTPMENPFPLVTPRRYGDCVVFGGGPGTLSLKLLPFLE